MASLYAELLIGHGTAFASRSRHENKAVGGDSVTLSFGCAVRFAIDSPMVS
jgi:hypothetical protein